MLFSNSPPLKRSGAVTLFPSHLWAILCLSFITTSIAARSAADYYVHSLPGQPAGPLLKMHAGHIEVEPEHNGNLFFWHFQNRHLANRHRTVIWLNGGPGCSSMDGALMEVGPYRLSDNEHLTYNDGAWDEFANMLFIDNPIGTGFSYVDTDSYDHELKQMADHMVVFLQKFFTLFPEYEENDIYIAGESYAGQYIPYVAQAILDRNALPKTTSAHLWNLSGLLIGNGWIAPAEQSYAYLEMAYKSGVVQKGSDIGKRLEATEAICRRDLEKDGNNPHVDYPNCEDILRNLLKLSAKEGRCVNMYDVRLDDTYPSCGMNWPPDLENITPYLRRREVVAALNVDHDKRSGWTECSGAVGGAFKPRNSLASITILPKILEQVPVLIFSGDKDLICNHLGTEALIHNMEWNGGKGFELSPGTWAPRRDWTFEGEPAGIYQEARNLTYVLFYNSSHMVPFNYPRRSRDMLDRFMKVDIASIGGLPSDSRIDGEKGLETSVGGHPNSTKAELMAQEKLDAERWAAYYRSGAIALVVVIILALCFTWWVWRDRRRRAGYQGVFGGSDSRLMQEGAMRRDMEAGEFDESELDDLHAARGKGEQEARYSVGGLSDDEDGGGPKEKGLNGHVNGDVGVK